MTVGSKTPESSEIPDGLDKFEFDEWRELFERDPELFERYRKQLLEQQIDLAPDSAKPRLLGLMFQMEAEARRSPTPISYSLRLSAMMMDKFEELRQKLELLTSTQAEIAAELQPDANSAEVIRFEQYHSRKNNSPDQIDE